jgi:Domain of unknown function (DUF4157)
MVGPAGDRFEQEADRIADVVLAGGDAPGIARRGPVAQRRCAACEGEGEVAHRKCAACAAEEPLVQRQSDGSAETAPALGARIDARRGSGAPLPGATRAQLEPRFGHDLSGVRVHTDGEAASLNRALGAAAFTIGGDIFFGAGRYQPDSAAGRRLLAHELTHTVQQGAVSSLEPNALRLQRLPFPRIQKMDDASFEALSGVNTALTATPPTMATVPSVHGATFTASACPGTAAAAPPAASACNVAFRFDKAYKGDFHYQTATGRVVRGLYVKITMTPTAGCGACTPLRSIQVLRSVTMGTGGAMQATDPVDPVRRQRSGWSATGPVAGAASPGWRVDNTTTSASPYIWHANDGDATHPTVMWDSPGDWANLTNIGREFRSCALCSVGGRNVSLACVTWGFYTNGSGTIAFQPTPVASCGAPTELRDASARWDSLPGNTHVNLAP